LFIFLNPFVVYFFLCLTTYIFYKSIDEAVIFNSVIILFVGLLLYPLYVDAIKNVRNHINTCIDYNNPYGFLSGAIWRFFAYFVILSNLIEFAYFGVPLFGASVYVDYGFPLLHHVAVSSWLLLFVKGKLKIERYLFVIFGVLTPIFILNRDLLMLSSFVFVLYLLLSSRIKLRYLLLFGFSMLLFFGFLGQVRSAYAMSIVSLPTTFDLSSVSPYLFWPFVYLTSSTFNFSFNFELYATTLYDPLINVFPEYYKFYLMFPDYGFFGIYLYFIFTFFILVLVAKLKGNFKFLLFGFVFYQFLMGVVFADKFYTTHTLFVFVLFIFLYVLHEIVPIKNPHGY